LTKNQWSAIKTTGPFALSRVPDRAPGWWWQAQPSNLLTEATVMIFAILTSLAAIGLMCWLLFNLAVYALPAFVGFAAANWAHNTGAGVIGAIIVGLVVAALTFAAAHLLLAIVRPTWLKMTVAFAFVAPSAIAGFHATHGIVKHLMPSETWQTVFSIVGALAIGATALVRITGMTAQSGPDTRLIARA
jgi:hypothetical protein